MMLEYKIPTQKSICSAKIDFQTTFLSQGGTWLNRSIRFNPVFLEQKSQLPKSAEKPLSILDMDFGLMRNLTTLHSVCISLLIHGSGTLTLRITPGTNDTVGGLFAANSEYCWQLFPYLV